MAVKVVDASAVAALLFGEAHADSISDRLEGASLAAPALLDFELANVCLVKSRRNPDQRAALASAFSLRDRLGVDDVAVDHDEVVKLAAATGLTAYDASYLWLSRRLNAELVTLDDRLGRAAAARVP